MVRTLRARARRRFWRWAGRWLRPVLAEILAVENNAIVLPDGTVVRRMSSAFAEWVHKEGWSLYSRSRK